jgi:hypothetical protein
VCRMSDERASTLERVLRAAALLLFLAAVVAACGADERTAQPVAAPPPATPAPPPTAPPAPEHAAPPASPPPASPTPAPAAPPAPSRPQPQCELGKVHAVGDEVLTFAAVAKRPLTARRSPNGDPIGSFETVNVNNHATVFQVRGVTRDSCGQAWYYAALPMRPNGVAGFIRARDVRIEKVRTRIALDLSQRELVLYRDNEPILSAPVAVGAPSTPTPTGRYYVNQRIIASDPTGPWGPAALGISAFSDVLQEWSQGGPIAIHGTNDPSSIGRAASHGCVRLENDVLRRVFETARAGTPVIIQA